MQFKPILFSTEMVQAILAGRKTKTRRLLAYDKDISLWERWNSRGDGKHIEAQGVAINGKRYTVPDRTFPEGMERYCPYGVPNYTILWVRESAYYHKQEARYFYKASDALTDSIEYGYRWKPSIHMPKEACRLFLQVKAIRVERLQAISESDAIAEGVESWIDERMASKPVRYRVYEPNDDPEAMYSSDAYNSFLTLWQSINGIESWKANPWVWVVEFERVERPAGFLNS